MAEPQKAVSSDRFTFQIEPHASGGFARVIRGRDNVLDRDIAVKVLNPLTAAFTESEQERFRREARILAHLSHPNIPAIYDIDFSDGRFLIIFQFIEGQTLRNIIENQGPCDLSLVKLWFHQITSALDHAHQLSIVHRDIKPENIIVRPDKESAYLVDFGIALSAEDARRLTSSGYAIGTPGYMSPEQQAGEKVDARSDIYSLAVTMYEALAGRPIPVGHYESLCSTNEAIPPQVDDLIQDCLLPREQRLDSLRVFVSRLAGALQPARPLSDVLTHGRLHELASSIEALDAPGFARLPEGQRALILTKVVDITSSGDSNLNYASERLLVLMLTRGLQLDKEQYREIVSPAVQWAFVKKFEEYVGRESVRLEVLGRESVRVALEDAAFEARYDSYDVLKEEFARYVSEADLDGKEDWFLHKLRDVVEALLANPAATSGTADLVLALRKVNGIQRSRASSRHGRGPLQLSAGPEKGLGSLG